jgi:hypothetical protein
MIKLKLKEGIPDLSEGLIARGDYEKESDQKLIEAFAKRGFELDPATAYKAWLALSRKWSASWLTWMGDDEEMMAQYWKLVEVVK